MDNTLIHHGIKGQRWGVRRFQNKDGTLKNIEKRKNKNVTSNKSKNTKNNDDKEVVKTGRRYAAIILGSVIGQVTAHSLMSGTDQEITPGAMFVGRTVGSVWGATVADVLVSGLDKKE